MINRRDISDDSEWIICKNINRALPFYITEMGKFNCNSKYNTEIKDSDNYIFIFTVSGVGKISFDGKSFPVNAGSAVIFHCSLPYTCRASENGWKFRWMKLGGSGVKAYERLINKSQCSEIPVVFRDSVLQNMRYSELLAERSDIISLVQISNTLSDILSTILTQRLSSQLSSDRSNSHYNDIHSAVDYIHSNYEHDISLNDMIAHVNISKYYFIRLFKEQIGMTPYEYMINYRIFKAKTMLRLTDKSVNEISSKVGFSSPSNFIQKFKKSEGISPAVYRREFSAYNKQQNRLI